MVSAKKKLQEEYKGDSLRKETSPILRGTLFLLCAVLVFAIGSLTHYMQTGGLANDQIVSVLIGQLHMKFITDFFVGFFTGIFAVIGLHYMRKKGES